MARFKDAVEAFVASREWDQATRSRLAFWVEVFGEKDLAAISADDIDAGLLELAERGRLKGGKRNTVAVGKPLAGSTLNRYLTQAGSVFKYAKRLRLVPRTFISPTRAIERSPERADPERYLKPEEVGRILTVARVVDRRWGKIAALITVAFHTGLRAMQRSRTTSNICRKTPLSRKRAVAALREGRVIRHRLGYIQATEPAVRGVDMPFLAQTALRPNAKAVAYDQHPAHQLRIDQWRGSETVEGRAMPTQLGCIEETIDATQHVIRRDVIAEIKE